MFSAELDLLRRLVDAPGLPGREHAVASIIEQQIPPDWQTNTDRVGNVIAHLPAAGPRLMLVAHTDEVGLIVRRITPEGFLLVERLGGISIRALPGSPLTLWTASGNIPAQVGILPQHLDHTSFIELTAMYVDVGVSSLIEVKKMGIQIGDALTWDAPLITMGNGRIRAKALDDRLGCFTLLNLAQHLHSHSIKPSYDLYMAFVVQEENMLVGGLPAVQQILPEIVIGVDGTLPSDTPDLKNINSDIRLGSGPCIKIMDAVRGKGTFVPSWRWVEKCKSIAQKRQIPFQYEIAAGISTALFSMPFVGAGVECLGLSFPVRYHHTPVEMADLHDIDQLTELLLALITTENAAYPTSID